MWLGFWMVVKLSTSGWLGISHRKCYFIKVKLRFETRAELPEFMIIENIILNNYTPYAITASLDTIGIVRHFHYYYVKLFQPQKKVVVNLKLFNNSEPLWLLRSF